MTDEFVWTEKYRPGKLEDCVLPPRIKKTLQAFIDQGNIPTMLFTGGAGVGKTTAAIAMCKELGINYLFINASKENGVDTIKVKVDSYASTASLNKSNPRKVVILDEADWLTPGAQANLRGIIEEYSSNCTFIYTCNFKHRLIDAMHSRTITVDFTLKPEEKDQLAAFFMKRVIMILQTEGIKFEMPVLAEVIKRYFPDFRKIINELQGYTVATKTLDTGVLSQIVRGRNLDALFISLKTKNFKTMRQWVADNSGVEPAAIFRSLFDALTDKVQAGSIPPAILILSKYQYQSAFVADQEINTTACLVELMSEVEIK